MDWNLYHNLMDLVEKYVNRPHRELVEKAYEYVSKELRNPSKYLAEQLDEIEFYDMTEGFFEDWRDYATANLINDLIIYDYIKKHDKVMLVNFHGFDKTKKHILVVGEDFDFKFPSTPHGVVPYSEEALKEFEELFRKVDSTDGVLMEHIGEMFKLVEKYGGCLLNYF